MSEVLKPSIVIVSDRTLSADYKILFEGMFATMQTTQVPEMAITKFLAPKIGTDKSGRANKAVLGMRRVESCIVDNTSLGENDVVCVTPESLSRVMGPWVKAVFFSSSDPLGKGMSNTTTTNFWKGELYTRVLSLRLLEYLKGQKGKYGFKVIAGGGGAWQFNHYKNELAKEVIDTVFTGYFEGQGPGLIEKILAGEELPERIDETNTCTEKVCALKGASVFGIVELSRGCGRGCRFCTMAGQRMEHLSVDMIMGDIETNLSNGIDTVVSGSEDFLRYGARGLKPDFDKICELLSAMQKLDGLSFMQVDHCNVSSAAQMSYEELKDIRDLMRWRERVDHLWVNMGIESANGHLVAANCGGKVSPFEPDNWAEIVLETADKMNRAGFFTVFSFILGLPGETRDDVLKSIELVKKLEKKDAVIFPIFYEPLLTSGDVEQQRFTIKEMTMDHLELYSRCYEINFRQVPRLFWDNQRAAGISIFKRALLRCLGTTEVVSWRKTFKRMRKDLSR